MERKVRRSDTQQEVPFSEINLILKPYRKIPVIIRACKIANAFEVETLEGIMKGNPGDYLIEGIKGELYPCKPDIFELTYEAIKNTPEKGLDLTRKEG